MYIMCCILHTAGYTAYLTTGDVVHLSGRSDLGMMCAYISTFLTDGAAKWNHKEGLLAVVGVDSTEKILKTKILSCSGKCLMTLSLPRAQVVGIACDSHVFFFSALASTFYK